MIYPICFFSDPGIHSKDKRTGPTSFPFAKMCVSTLCDLCLCEHYVNIALSLNDDLMLHQLVFMGLGTCK